MKVSTLKRKATEVVVHVDEFLFAADMPMLMSMMMGMMMMGMRMEVMMGLGCCAVS